MAGIISRREAFELATSVAVSPMICFLFDKKYPCPNRLHHVTLSIILVLTTYSLDKLGHKAVRALSARAGYLDGQGKVINGRYYYLKASLVPLINLAMLIFYRSIGQRLNLQLPNLLENIGYFSLNMGISVSIIQATYAFVPHQQHARR